MSKEIMNSAVIKLNDVKKYITANVNLQLKQRAAARLYMIGAPGCGKSDIVREICQENKWGLAVRYISNMSIEQMTGLPVKPTEGEVATWSVPELFNFNNIEYKPEGYQIGKTPTVLLLDDFHLCDRTMQRYMFQLLTYMGLNGYHLPANTAIILAGNRNNDKAGAMPIPAPVCNRMMFIEVTSEAEDWLKNFALKTEFVVISAPSSTIKVTSISRRNRLRLTLGLLLVVGLILVIRWICMKSFMAVSIWMN